MPQRVVPVFWNREMVINDNGYWHLVRRIRARLVEERVATGESWAIYEFEFQANGVTWPTFHVFYWLDVTNGRMA